MRAYLALGAALAFIAALTVSHWQVDRVGRAVEQAAFTQQINKENTEAASKMIAPVPVNAGARFAVALV